jgi:hypothetical protein
VNDRPTRPDETAVFAATKHALFEPPRAGRWSCVKCGADLGPVEPPNAECIDCWLWPEGRAA